LKVGLVGASLIVMSPAPSPTVTVFNSQTPKYHEAFQVFLDNTDQKVKARERLDAVVKKLPKKRVFIDAGAGTGSVTAWFTGTFERTIANEPNDSLRADLKKNCPNAEIHPDMILASKMPAQGDLVLCSHVFYYIDRKEWMPTLERLASWVAPEGVLTVIIQNHHSDCMRMLQHFFGHHYNLTELGDQFRQTHAGRYSVEIVKVPSSVETQDFNSAYTIAEFMLNLVPITDPPSRAQFEEYVREKFGRNGNGFRFSVDQTFLEIRPRG
jgi:hypothetical protein